VPAHEEAKGDSSKDSGQVFTTCDIRTEKIAPFIGILLTKLRFIRAVKEIPALYTKHNVCFRVYSILS